MIQPGMMFNTLASFPLDSMSVQTAPPPDPTSDHLQRCMDSVQELAKTIACAIDKWHGSGLLDGFDIHGTYAKVSAHLEQLPPDVECMRCTRRTYKSALQNSAPSRVSLSGTCTCDADSEPVKRRRTSGTLPHKLAITDQTEPSDAVVDTVVPSARSSCDPCYPPPEGCQIQEYGLPPFSADHDLGQSTALADSQFLAHPKPDTWQGGQEARATLKPDEVFAELEKKQKELEDDMLKAPIKFKDAVGRKYTFPWHLCKTWKGIENLIREAFLHVDVVGTHVQEGYFDLMSPEGEIILPQVWEAIIKPDWEVSMHMWPIHEKPEKEKKKKKKREEEKLDDGVFEALFGQQCAWIEAGQVVNVEPAEATKKSKKVGKKAKHNPVTLAAPSPPPEISGPFGVPLAEMPQFSTREEYDHWAAALPGGLPGQAPPAAPAAGGMKRRGPPGKLSDINKGADSNGDSKPEPKKPQSQMDKYAQFIDKETGALRLAGKATVDSRPKKHRDGKKAKRISVLPAAPVVAGPSTVPEMLTLNTQEEWEHWKATAKPPKMKKISGIAAWMASAPVKPAKKRVGKLEQRQEQRQQRKQQLANISHPQTLIQASSEDADLDRLPPSEHLIFVSDQSKPLEDVVDTATSPHRSSRVSRDVPQMDYQDGPSPRQYIDPSILDLGLDFDVDIAASSPSPEAVDWSEADDGTTDVDEHKSVSPDHGYNGGSMSGLMRQIAPFNRSPDHGGDEDDPDEDMESNSDNDGRFRARSLRRSNTGSRNVSRQAISSGKRSGNLSRERERRRRVKQHHVRQDDRDTEMANSIEDKNFMDSDPPEFHQRQGSADPSDEEMFDLPSPASTDSLPRGDVGFGANLHDTGSGLSPGQTLCAKHDLFWSRERVQSWLAVNDFSDVWQAAFDRLGVHGSQFLDLGRLTSVQREPGFMNGTILPQVMRECVPTVTPADPACILLRDEARRLRRLVRDLVPDTMVEERDLPDYVGSETSLESQVVKVPRCRGGDSPDTESPYDRIRRVGRMLVDRMPVDQIPASDLPAANRMLTYPLQDDRMQMDMPTGPPQDRRYQADRDGYPYDLSQDADTRVNSDAHNFRDSRMFDAQDERQQGQRAQHQQQEPEDDTECDFAVPNPAARRSRVDHSGTNVHSDSSEFGGLEAVDDADDQATGFGGHRGASSDCDLHSRRPPTNMTGGYNIDFDPSWTQQLAGPIASSKEDVLDLPSPARKGSPPRLQIPPPPIQGKRSQKRLRAKSDRQPLDGEPRAHNAPLEDSQPWTSATYLPEGQPFGSGVGIPPLSTHDVNLQPGRSAVLAMLRAANPAKRRRTGQDVDDVNVEKQQQQQQQQQQPQQGRQGKRPHLEALSSTDVEPFAHAEDVRSTYERLCNEVLTGRPCHSEGRSEEAKGWQMAKFTPFAPEYFEPQLLGGLTSLRHDSSSKSSVNDKSRSPSPPRRHENRAAPEPKTNSDVGSDEEVTADVSAVQALLNRWLDCSASALLLKDDRTVA
jgi:hypothetical protein